MSRGLFASDVWSLVSNMIDTSMHPFAGRPAASKKKFQPLGQHLWTRQSPSLTFRKTTPSPIWTSFNPSALPAIHESQKSTGSCKKRERSWFATCQNVLTTSMAPRLFKRWFFDECSTGNSVWEQITAFQIASITRCWRGEGSKGSHIASWNLNSVRLSKDKAVFNPSALGNQCRLI